MTVAAQVPVAVEQRRRNRHGGRRYMEAQESVGRISVGRISAPAICGAGLRACLVMKVTGLWWDWPTCY